MDGKRAAVAFPAQKRHEEEESTGNAICHGDETSHGPVSGGELGAYDLVGTEQVAQGAAPDVDQAGLTNLESRILDLIAQGKSNKLIARELNIAEGTVKVHVKHLLRKLNLRSRVEAAVWAVDRRRG